MIKVIILPKVHFVKGHFYMPNPNEYGLASFTSKVGKLGRLGKVNILYCETNRLVSLLANHLDGAYKC